MNTIDNGLLENEISPQDQSEGYMEIVPGSVSPQPTPSNNDDNNEIEI